MQSQEAAATGSEPGRAPARRKPKRPAGGDDTGDERRRKMPAASSAAALRDLLRGFLEQQLRLDLQRHEMVERQARERRFFEEQWRQAMQRVERERLMMEREWVQREEQRRAGEEARAERRDAILTSLLTRLLHGDL